MMQANFRRRSIGRQFVAAAAVLIWACLGLPVQGHSAQEASKPDHSRDIVLIAPESSDQTPIPAGDTATMIVLLTNSGEVPRPVPPLIYLILTGEDARPVRVAARLQDGKGGQISPGGFARLAYGFEIPLQMTGLVRAREAGMDSNTAMFFAGPPEDGGEEVAPQNPDPKPVTAMLPKFQPFFVNFYPYKPVYFLFGADPGIQDTSFQLSFKYKPFNFTNPESKDRFKTTLDRIYLAYTQQSFWDLKSDSAPFEDSRYMPEIFYYDDDLGLSLPWLIGSGFQAGYQHESNGRGGNESRSTNYAYLNPSLIFEFTPRLHMLLSPKAWVYVNNNHETNGDLADYRGYFDLESRIGDPEGLALGSHYRHGHRGPTFQFDLSYPLNQIPGLEGMLDMYLHAQYYTGYSNQMLQYNQREDIFRIGFSLVR